MFGYVPSSGEEDFFPPRASDVPAEGLLRTKARYYQLAVGPVLLAPMKSSSVTGGKVLACWAC